MAISNFPPQAYTRDMLASAYEWLRHQPPSTRELAQDSDSLVALYLQSRRRGASHPSQSQPSVGSSSVESFKQELKTLTEGLKQFETPGSVSQSTLPMATQTHAHTSALPQQTAVAAQVQPPVSQEAHVATAAHIQAPLRTTKVNVGTQSQAPSAPVIDASTLQSTSSGSISVNLDARSLEVIHAVKNRLNLSSDSETLRMIIALGYDKIREFLPKM